MRVALICPYSLSRPGGVQSQVVSLAAALDRLGLAVLVVAPLDEPLVEARRRLVALPAAVDLVPAGRSFRLPVNGSQAPVALGPSATRAALRALRAWHPDVLHLHEPFVPAVAVATLAEHRAPIVGTFHRAGSGALYRATRPLARLGFARVDDAVAVSAAARATLTEVVGRLAARCELVPNGIALDRFVDAAPWPSRRPTLVFVGRHEARKGLGLLLAAFSAIDRDIGLWVIGAGPETASLRRRYAADDRIEWCGKLGDGDVARRLAGAQVFVAPGTGGESFGVVLLEAMAAGTAVVASDIEGYRSAAGGAALLVPPGDAAALRGSIVALLDGEVQRSSLVAAGRRRAVECSIDTVAARYAERYRHLAGTSRSR